MVFELCWKHVEVKVKVNIKVKVKIKQSRYWSVMSQRVPRS